MSRIGEKLYILDEEDPYRIMGVKDNADIEEINRVYKKLAKEFHPDRNVNLSGIEKENLNAIFTKITAAFNQLKDPEERNKIDLRKKFNKKYFVEPIKKESNVVKKNNNETPPEKNTFNFKNEGIKEVKKNKAYILFNEGVELYQNKNIDAAIARLQSAIELNYSEAIYHSYLGLAMLDKGWNGYAMSEFKIALNFNPQDPIALKHYIPDQTKEKKENGVMEKFIKLMNKRIF